MTFSERLSQHKWKVLQFIVYLIIFGWVFLRLIGSHFYEKIMNDLPKYKHNPFFIPVAGFFKRPDSTKSNTETTSHNFSGFLWSLIKKFFHTLMMPIQYVLKIITKNIHDLSNTLNIFRHQAKIIRQMFQKFVGENDT